jgi:hypothetical protein
LDSGRFRFNWAAVKDFALGFSRAGNAPLCCFDNDGVHTFSLETQDIITDAAGGNNMWLLGESGSLYRMDKVGQVYKGNLSADMKPALSIACFGDNVVLSYLDTSADFIGPRLNIYRDRNGELQKKCELFFPSDQGHHQYSFIDPFSEEIYTFCSYDNEVISLLKGKLENNNDKTAITVPTPFIHSVKKAFICSGIIYVLDERGGLHATDSEGRRLCSIEAVRKVDCLFDWDGCVFVSSGGQLYRVKACNIEMRGEE